jgi:hypothetical protein
LIDKFKGVMTPIQENGENGNLVAPYNGYKPRVAVGTQVEWFFLDLPPSLELRAMLLWHP